MTLNLYTHHRRHTHQQGFTLLELMITVATVVVGIFGTLQLLTHCLWLSESGGNQTAALWEAEAKLEEIRHADFSTIVATYGSSGAGRIFTPAHLAGKGTVYIDATDPDLLDVTVVVSWRDELGQVLSEDRNLNGILDTGEDANNNGQLDSPAELRALIANR